MPQWTTPSTPAAERARSTHAELVGTAPAHVASAPGTWSLVGEHIDHYGGLAVMGLSHLRAAAAVSPRTDGEVRVRVTGAGGEETGIEEDSLSLEQLGELAAQQQPSTDADGQPVVPPAPAGGVAARLGGIVHTMIGRQLLSRDTTGADITIAHDLPQAAGLGRDSAADVATALALVGESEELGDAPMRARIAEVCSQAVGTFSAIPALRSRHSAALRSAAESVTIVDYADDSVTQAPHPVNRELAAFAVAVAGDDLSPTAAQEIRRRERFVDDACHAFGTESLRLLPDAPQRVIDWLAAVHKVHGTQNQPTIAQATEWLAFYEEETARAHTFARALRSRRGAELFPVINQSQAALKNIYGFDSADNLCQLLIARGAAGARSAHAGLNTAAFAYVPQAKAANFAADLAADGLVVVELQPGEPARLD